MFCRKTETEENVHDDVVIEDTIIEDTVIEDTIIEDKDTVIEDTISKDTIEDTIIEDTIEDISETLPVETPSTETPLQEMDKEEIVKTVSSPTGRVLFPCLPEAGQRNLKEKYIVAISNFSDDCTFINLFLGYVVCLSKTKKICWHNLGILGLFSLFFVVFISTLFNGNTKFFKFVFSLPCRRTNILPKMDAKFIFYSFTKNYHYCLSIFIHWWISPCSS